jgi:hypothetical protein
MSGKMLDLYKRSIFFLGITSLLTLLYVLTMEVILFWSVLSFGILTIASLWVLLYYLCKSIDELKKDRMECFKRNY